MTSTKRQAYLETAVDLLQKAHTDLLHHKQFSKAEQLQEIMRRLVVFSSRKKQPKGITFSELNRITKDEGVIPPIIQIEEPEAEEAELKPCPFCGSNPVFGKPSETKTSLRCSNPECYLWWNPPTSWHNGDKEERARLRLTTWWNRRAE